MRRVCVIGAATILVLAFGFASDARQADTGQPPPYGQVNPPFQKSTPYRGDRLSFVGKLCIELTYQAEYLAESSYDYYMGWNGMINNHEQAILFESEEFAAACRLFHKLSQDNNNYFRRDSLRTNLHNAFLYVKASFRELEDVMRAGGMKSGFFSPLRRDGRRYEPRPFRGTAGPGPYGLDEIRRILNRIEAEFTGWR